MDSTEATTNMIVAMISNKFIASPEDVAEAYKTIYNAVVNPYKN